MDIMIYTINMKEYETYRAQSAAMIIVMSSVGSPTEVNTITIVTKPAW